MREIKFRAWNKEKKGFIAGFNMFNYHGYYNENLEPSIKRYGSEWKASEIILLQYTGLKDKNGKEIYEGDVIQTHLVDDGTLGEVIFADGCFKFKWTDGQVTIHHKWGVDDIKIIGNKYENPELLDAG